MNPSFQHELGLEAYKAYCESWTSETHMERYFEIINDLEHR